MPGWVGGMGQAGRMDARRLAVAVVFVGLVACGGGDKTAPTTSTTSPSAPTSTASPTTTLPPDAASGPAGGPVPAGFGAASVTFVSLETGWVLGTAPCSSPPCTSVLRTVDGGQTWVGIPAPPTELASGAGRGVRRIRFADAANGWAFGPDLWSTHDGGAHWIEVSLPSVDADSEVSDLEAADGKVHVAVLDSKGVVILTSPVGTDGWQASPTVVPIGAGPVPQADIVLQGDTGWMFEVDRVVVGGAGLTGGAWVPWPPPCADAGGAAFLAASSADDLVAVCDEGQWNDRPRAVRFYDSSDGGATFDPVGVPVPLSGAAGVTAGQAGSAVVAGSDSSGAALLVATFDGGATWSTVYQGPRGGWNEIGFTSPSQGVAVVGDGSAAVGPLLMTKDGGHTWDAVVFGSG
ncbi:MAG: hypothetical protein QOG82_1984 [Actinomycetota bacterium]|nr:hypothetical protein [Actinomycetota bacterium]